MTWLLIQLCWIGFIFLAAIGGCVIFCLTVAWLDNLITNYNRCPYQRRFMGQEERCSLPKGHEGEHLAN